MKKFEEELKRPSDAGIEPFSKRDVSFEKLSSKFTKGAQTLKEWKEYAFKAEDKIRELESQLEKQQPEIPEFVAAAIEAKNHIYGDFRRTANITHYSEDVRYWYYAKPYHAELFYRAILDGYTVAKEKRFYLKNKLTGQRLIRLLEENGDGFLECVTTTDKERMQFTQQEIDSMAAESYEQIEVTE